MNKDSQAKVGSTPCDLCEKVSAHVVGDQLLCEDHAAALSKSASADTPLKDAGRALKNKHR